MTKSFTFDVDLGVKAAELKVEYEMAMSLASRAANRRVRHHAYMEAKRIAIEIAELKAEQKQRFVDENASARKDKVKAMEIEQAGKTERMKTRNWHQDFLVKELRKVVTADQWDKAVKAADAALVEHQEQIR